MKTKILFLCSHNSARSQIAEGLMNSLYGEQYEAYSAGTEATRVHPYAIKVMKEIGIDISHHTSKTAVKFLDTRIDYVVTVCDQAREVCPFFPGAFQYLHENFQDPSSAEGTEEEILDVFRRVRDEIKAWIEKTFGENEQIRSKISQKNSSLFIKN
ncbi:MAG: arsenate reductase ArsC [Promethearchaeota archaeon]